MQSQHKVWVSVCLTDNNNMNGSGLILSPWEPKGESPFDGPRTPAIDKPDTGRLLKRMRSTDKDGSKKYRQRSGE